MPLRLLTSGAAIAALAATLSAPAFAQSAPEAGTAPAQPAQAQPSSEPAAAPPPEPQPAPSVAPAPRASASRRHASAGPARVRSSVNLRRGPGESYEVLTLIPAGSAITVRSCSGEWCAVHWQGSEGYAIARNLDMGARQAAYGPPPARRRPVTRQGKHRPPAIATARRCMPVHPATTAITARPRPIIIAHIGDGAGAGAAGNGRRPTVALLVGPRRMG